jgi:ubiquinone/menaquinone biosynthesis C-methylase UbiE
MGESSELRIADFVLAIEGLAMARSLFVAPERVAERAAEVAFVVAGSGDGLLAHQMAVTKYDVDGAYTRWAPRYDGPNPAIETEQPLVRALVSGLTPGVALDAACGTARHSEMLTAMGWSVIGVDATAGMLDVGRTKVPAADFRLGRLEALPVDDASVDLVVCALALTHVDELGPVYAEFARVLRRGGRVVTSDIHPLVTISGGMAGFPIDDSGRSPLETGFHFVPNLTHHASEYVDAITRAGLQIVACHEPRFTEDLVQRQPTFEALPDATRQAYGGLPFLLIWEAVKPSA